MPITRKYVTIGTNWNFGDIQLRFGTPHNLIKSAFLLGLFNIKIYPISHKMEIIANLIFLNVFIVFIIFG